MIFYPILPVAVKENNKGVPAAVEFFVTDQTDGSQLVVICQGLETCVTNFCSLRIYPFLGMWDVSHGED